ncbi:hypothetical protein BDP27DRAFT_1336954 [Rhodocollybia butyracea]|uniref:Uncharacterized protein n=1 Tax=Rhodocollybia butyracea TaxID=206335 RepID=A0A9P5U181_9AGAR|nr:hypothetical protein BDP27DRAFT_1336954 [Rhodocollybia butyracea]
MLLCTAYILTRARSVLAADWAGRSASILIAVLEQFRSALAFVVERMALAYAGVREAILAFLDGGCSNKDGETHCEERRVGL